MSQITTTVNSEANGVTIGDENANPIPDASVAVLNAKHAEYPVCTGNLFPQSSNPAEGILQSQPVTTNQSDEHDHPENLNAPAAVKQLVAVIGAAAEVIDLEEVSAFKEEAPVTITADTGDSPAPITCRPFMMKYSTDSRAEIRVDLGTHSCTDMRCCAADGCCTLVCMTHGFGEGFEEPYNDDAGFPSRVCQQNGCDVVFCERHFGRMMSECDSCRNISSAEMELEGSGIHLELAKSFFCPSHATVRCNLRYRFDGDKLDEKEAYRERKTVAKDMEYAEQGDAVLGSMGLSADCLFQEIAAKKSKREANDDRRGIGHCSFMLCQECVADKWHRHRCCDDPDDFNTLF